MFLLLFLLLEDYFYYFIIFIFELWWLSIIFLWCDIKCSMLFVFVQSFVFSIYLLVLVIYVFNCNFIWKNFLSCYLYCESFSDILFFISYLFSFEFWFMVVLLFKKGLFPFLMYKFFIIGFSLNIGVMKFYYCVFILFGKFWSYFFISKFFYCLEYYFLCLSFTFIFIYKVYGFSGIVNCLNSCLVLNSFLINLFGLVFIEEVILVYVVILIISFYFAYSFFSYINCYFVFLIESLMFILFLGFLGSPVFMLFFIKVYVLFSFIKFSFFMVFLYLLFNYFYICFFLLFIFKLSSYWFNFNCYIYYFSFLYLLFMFVVLFLFLWLNICSFI